MFDVIVNLRDDGQNGSKMTGIVSSNTKDELQITAGAIPIKDDGGDAKPDSILKKNTKQEIVNLV
jgi:hypothetical protein